MSLLPALDGFLSFRPMEEVSVQPPLVQQEGHVVNNPAGRRPRHSMSNSETSLSEVQDPTCQACLNLNWDDYNENEPGESPYERNHFIGFSQIISGRKNGCSSCTVLNNVITEFSKPLLKQNVDFVGKLLSSDLHIQLRRGYSTMVEVMEGIDDPERPYFAVEIYKNEPTIPPVLSAAKNIPPSIDLDYLVKFVESKRQVCELEHQHWSSEKPSLPSRVLSIGKKSGMIKIKIIETLGLTGKYVALSHCWGQGFMPLETTKDTLPSYLKDIDFQQLPKTFQDAVQITESLGFSYLWIDSLCIVQHDEADWKKEAGKMEDVYSNASITLAATGSSSSLGGCLFLRRHVTDYGITISHEISNFLSDSTFSNGFNFRYWARSHMQVTGEHLSTTIGGAPLLTRAWALQERLLSPVFLHFHGEELVWECQENISCECGFFDWEGMSYKNLQQRRTFSMKADFIRLSKDLGHLEVQQEACNFWLKFTEYFTSLGISKGSDQLPAVTGIARRLCRSIPGSYLLGVWSCDLARGLLWRKLPYQQGVRLTVPSSCHLPTWSWASIITTSSKEYGLTYSNLDDFPFKIDVRFNNGRNDLRQDVFVPGQRCSLILCGACITCTLKLEQPTKKWTPSHILNFQDQEEYMYNDVTCDFSTVDQSCWPSEVCCLLVGGLSEPQLLCTKDEDIKTLVYWSLVLHQLPSGDYERIGVAQHDSKKGWFDKAEMKQIVLV